MTGRKEPAITGPQHYQLAEQMLEHAASMLDANLAPEDRAELIQRQDTIATMATAHAVLAAAAAVGLSAHLDVADTSGWRDVAATRLGGPHT